MVQRGKISSKISSSKYGQYALDNAIRYPGGGKALYAYDGKYVYQFMPSDSSNTIYHGFITDFSGINNSKARNWLFHKFK